MLIGQLFALVGLAAGFFFFIFAAKYYGSILFVLMGKNRIENRLNWRNFNNHNNHNGNHNGFKTAHNGGGASQFPESHLRRGAVYFEINWPFGKARGFVRAISPLWLRKAWGAFSEVFGSIMYPSLQLSGQDINAINNNHGNGNGNHNGNGNGYGNNMPAPFVSIHLPFYNEKNVADRILTACTSLDYPNYEVVVTDDSIDETVEILEKWKAHPKVKVLHREVRRGWKGGALNEALKHMDPRTEYVAVFDADFIPPPDIIQQFLPYFVPQGNGNNHNNHNNTYYNGNNNHRSIDKNDYPRFIEKLEAWYEQRELAAIQGYQWHYLNAGENWMTRGIRAEYSSSYVIERTCQQLAGAMKMISGSVFMIKADVLKKHGWSNSMTEDWELTLRLYLDGYKVAYTPYIQAPAECPSTITQLVKQRVRWAEGHTYNAKKYFWEVLRSNKISLREKLEFIYYVPYYLQSFIFLIGTACWFLSEAMHQYLPFWIQIFGWSLLLSNLLSLPLMGFTGLFLEKNVGKDLTGIFSFIFMSYVLIPFQAYASLKGLLEEKERGTWIRTLKTGKITEALKKLEFRRIWRELLPRRRRSKAVGGASIQAETEANGGSPTKQRKEKGKAQPKQNMPKNNPRSNHKLSLFNGNKKPIVLILLLVMSSTLFGIAILGTTMPVTAAGIDDALYLTNTGTSGVTPAGYWMTTAAGSVATRAMTTGSTYYWYLSPTYASPYMINSGTYSIYLSIATASSKTWTVSVGHCSTGTADAIWLCSTIVTFSATSTTITVGSADWQDVSGRRVILKLLMTGGTGTQRLVVGNASTLFIPTTQVSEGTLLLLSVGLMIPLFFKRTSQKKSNRSDKSSSAS